MLVYARLFVAIALAMIWGGCILQQPLREHTLGDLGRFSFRSPDEQMKGIIVGAPHGIAEADA
ncbi:MAG TPA: hypothetical protein VFU31_05085 [Candidatus Binatia bacterium]|nr:hypothetical protein [Candidatus Binatia bacterium]